jgi:hypothetical protein
MTAPIAAKPYKQGVISTSLPPTQSSTSATSAAPSPILFSSSLIQTAIPPSLKDLLTQLQAAISSSYPQGVAAAPLSDDDKAEALEQVKTLAEAGTHANDGAGQKAAKTATKIIKGTIAALPPTTALVESVTKLLPLITKFFGF